MVSKPNKTVTPKKNKPAGSQKKIFHRSPKAYKSTNEYMMAFEEGMELYLKDHFAEIPDDVVKEFDEATNSYFKNYPYEDIAGMLRVSLIKFESEPNNWAQFEEILRSHIQYYTIISRRLIIDPEYKKKKTEVSYSFQSDINMNKLTLLAWADFIAKHKSN